MIRDHGAANAKLQAVAGEQKLNVPAALDPQHQGDVDKLRSAQGPIDPAYVDMQRKAHSDAVKLFESYARDGDNAALKTFAQRTVDTLKMHQQMIEKIAAGQDAITGATTPAVKTDTTPNAAALVPGANSFTEAQAKQRIEDAGYSNVSKLAKDDQGIWRGQATQAGEDLDVGLDYQGNVVAANK
jgi:putative membrane protein